MIMIDYPLPGITLNIAEIVVITITSNHRHIQIFVCIIHRGWLLDWLDRAVVF